MKFGLGKTSDFQLLIIRIFLPNSLDIYDIILLKLRENKILIETKEKFL